MEKRVFLGALGSAGILALGACASTPASTTIVDTAARSPQLTTLSRLLAQAGLQDTLRGTGPFTVFAPSDEAFKAVPALTMAKLAADPALLRDVLSYHVLAGKVLAAEVKNGNAATVQGGNVALAKAGSFVTIEDAVVQTADVPASNGVVHIIDRVLMPPAKK
jgi:uncharacterized surface protein with fasciclin (FAS1) repeats